MSIINFKKKGGSEKVKEKSAGFDENDEFWSLESMLPPVHNKYEKKINDTGTAEIEISGTETPEGQPVQSRYPPITQSVKSGEKIDFSSWLAAREKYKNDTASNHKRTVRKYVPDSPLVKMVTVSETVGAREVKERFIDDGKRLFGQNGPFEGNVRYDAVYPQYASMDESQKRCYIGFRSELRAGKYPQVDKAYIYLYLYELINITDLLSAQERADALAGMICGYSDCDERLFSDMCNWLCDICLIEQIPIPRRLFGDVHPRILRCARSREIFIEHSENCKSRELYALMLTLGRYDYRSSRFYPENKAFYDRYIESAVCQALERIAERDSRFRWKEDETCVITHESFFGAYRTINARKTVTLECVCMTHGDDERRIVSDLTKYAENCLRNILGIKQKLTVSYINLEKKRFIKEYFAKHEGEFPKRAAVCERKSISEHEVPEYERLYEVPKEEVSIEDASKIEERSWGVTEKLVGAFDENEYLRQSCEAEETEKMPMIEPVIPEIVISGQESVENDRLYIKTIELIKSGDSTALAELAKSKNMFVSALIDAVNEYLLDAIGDVAIEDDGMGYKISSWYEEDIDALIQERTESNGKQST